jgi:hypothetical protein
MSTTIQIDKHTKKELFQLKSELEFELGRSVTYNEIIQMLVDEKKKRKTQKNNNYLLRQLKGILPNKALNDYRSEKMKTIKAENDD